MYRSEVLNLLFVVDNDFVKPHDCNAFKDSSARCFSLLCVEIYPSLNLTDEGESILLLQVIVVTANYRVGPLGFMSLEDDVLPGKVGLI